MQISERNPEIMVGTTSYSEGDLSPARLIYMFAAVTKSKLTLLIS